jgi:hypothetical protein
LWAQPIAGHCCTVNWWRFTSSPPRNWRSVPVGAGLTQPLTWLTSGPVCEGLPQCPSQQRWCHHHRLISLPRPRCGNRVSASNPKLIDRLGRRARKLNITCGTYVSVSTTTEGDTAKTPRGHGDGVWYHGYQGSWTRQKGKGGPTMSQHTRLWTRARWPITEAI